MRFHVGLSLVLPLSAFAQSLTLTVNGLTDSTGQPALTTNQCSAAFVVNAVVASQQICSGPTYWITTSTSCGDSAGAADLQFSVDTAGNKTISVSDLPFFSGGDGGIPCPRAATQDHRVCGVFTVPSSLLTGCSSATTPVHPMGTATVRWKGAPAAVPSIDSVAPKDGAITLGLSITGTDALFIRVEVAVSRTGQFAQVASIAATQPTYTVNGLTNNVAYDVQVRSEDTIGNLSAYSPIATATPVASAGFYDAYRQAGGQDTGGCGGLGAILLAFCLPGIALGALARRKR